MMKVKVSFDTWLQLLGMLGVMGGLVALVIELNQSQKLSQANAYQVRISEIQEAQRELALSRIWPPFFTGLILKALTSTTTRRVE